MRNQNFYLCELKIFEELLDIAMEKLSENHINVGFSTGFIDIDELGLMQPGELVVIAGRPVIGKTTFVKDIVEHNILYNEKSVAIFTTKLTADNFIYRLICSIANIDLLRLKTKNLKDHEWHKIARAANRMHKSKLYICDKLRITPDQIIKAVCDIKDNIDLIIVDGFQYLYGNKCKYSNKTEEYTDIANSLKNIGKELNVSIIVTFKINKDSEIRIGNLPELSDLREYGELESLADKILFIHRDTYYNLDQKDNDSAQIIMARNKSGYVGTTNLIFNKESIRYEK